MTVPATPRIAWRNLWRNKRRTALALTAIGLSVALVLVYDGILRGYGDWMLQTATGPMLGHVQAHARGWRRNRSLDATVPGVARLLNELGRDSAVVGATARVYVPALAARGEEGFAILVIGLDIEEESKPMRLLAGARVPAGPGVLMGRLLADQMGVREGDELALVGQGVDGSLANDLFVVSALVETPVDLVNRQAVLMRLEQAQALFAMADEAHEIVIYGRDARQARPLASRLARVPSLAGLEVLDWETLAPAMVNLMAVVETAWMFVLALVLVAAAAGVANTMLMATFERTRELGMLLALGAEPLRIVRLVLVESLALAIVGAALGTVLGSALVQGMYRAGFDYATLTGGGPTRLSFFGMNWSLRLYPRLAWIDIVRTVVAVMATSIVAAAWPALRAARLRPVEALRS